MMDCGKKTLFFLTLCALVGAKRFQVIKKNLDILVSVPSTHIGDTVIWASGFLPTNLFFFTVGAMKNKTHCINSTNPLCTSLIKEPTVVVSVSSRASNGKSFNYSESINRSLWLEMQVDPEFSITPHAQNGQSDEIIVELVARHDTAKTSRRLEPRWSSTIFIVDAEFNTTMIIEDDNGQSALCCGPLSALILLALFPVLILQ